MPKLPRLSLRTQVLLPVVGVLVVTISALGISNVWLAVNNRQREQATRIQTVAETITRTNFPLTPRIAEQIKELVGADLLVQKTDGTVAMATTRGLPAQMPSSTEVDALRQGQIVRTPLADYLRATVAFRGSDGSFQWLHIYYPTALVAAERWQAVVPALIGAGLALLVAGLFSVWFAERISRPIRALREKTVQIAEGDFRPIQLDARGDEVGDLAVAVNQLARQLGQFQQETQQAERHRTLAQLGASLAHQLRNFATGAQLALDLHQERCALDRESLEIAGRQLRMIEQYLGKLLRLGAVEKLDWETLDLRDCLAEVARLLDPQARHAGVQLQLDLPLQPVHLRGDRDSLYQLVLNLATNAIEAASLPAGTLAAPNATPNPLPTTGSPAMVRMTIQATAADDWQLVVADTGPGPQAAIASRMFEPLVTDKPEGAGLGLLIVQRVAQLHRGQVTWARYNGWTEFRVTFASVSVPPELPAHATLVDRG